MMARQDDFFKHATSLRMLGPPDNKGLQGKVFVGDSDDEAENTSLAGKCSENDPCRVEELIGNDGLFASTSSPSDTQHDDVVRRNDPNACNERIAVSIFDDYRRSLSMNVVDFTLRDNQCIHDDWEDINARELNGLNDDWVQPAFVAKGKPAMIKVTKASL